VAERRDPSAVQINCIPFHTYPPSMLASAMKMSERHALHGIKINLIHLSGITNKGYFSEKSESRKVMWAARFSNKSKSRKVYFEKA
jgi:hypothetical protein